MPEAKETVTVRLPPDLLARIKDRADARDVYMADVLRSYIEAGDRADTRRETKEANR